VCEDIVATSDQVYFTFSRSSAEGVHYYTGYLERDNDTPFVMEWTKKYSVSSGTLEDSEPGAGEPPTVYAGGTVAIVSPTKGFLGFYTIDSGATSLDGLDLSSYLTDGDVFVGVPFGSRLVLLPVVIDDGQGSTLNRPHRMVRMIVHVWDTYQINIDGTPLFSATGTEFGQRLSPKNGSFEQRLLGWAERDAIEIRSASTYKAKILSVTREVSV